MSIENNSFENILKENFFFEKYPKIAVAVSGGPDSMALTFLLKDWIIKKKGKLIALIIDHRIRNESYFESKRVEKYLNHNHIETKLLKIRKDKVTKKNMKEARDNRFEKFNKYCKKNKIFHLFVAHHYDDNLETFLIRKISGSNFEGLRSMQEKIINKNTQILRPLLKFKKIDIIKYLKKNNILYEIDPSNQNLKYTRVSVRNFLKENTLFKKKIEIDFKEINKLYPLYKIMIHQIFNNLHISSSKNTIKIKSDIFFSIDINIQSKIVEIAYKFLGYKFFFIRQSKIIDMLNTLNKENIKKLNLKGMIVKKDLNTISFTNENRYF